MSQNKMQAICRGLHTLTVFRDLVKLPLFENFFCYVAEQDPAYLDLKLDCYSEMVCEIYRLGGSLTDAVRRALMENENVYVRAIASKQAIPAPIVTSVERELRILSAFASLSFADFQADLTYEGELAAFSSEPIDLSAEYAAHVAEIHKHGYGIFATSGMFRLSDREERKIEPIVSYDPVTLDSFIGYREEREKVLANTRAFVEGKPAANVLLYGDAGTGKSSTVKAVANHLFAEGIRLIEIRKDQMKQLPFVMEQISGNPLKFIIFIDDLSFNRNDDTFSMLKAALEGSASAKAKNAVIYATSNRRHIVRECFDDREGSDVHRNDTMQELLSLSARFGLSIQFGKPDKKLYLEIVHELAKKKGIELDPETLAIDAEAFALRRGHRSARCAEQFIDSLL